jgi:PAS domain S-box-containing protein
MQGFGWKKLHHPDHLERVVRRLHEFLASGTPWEDTFPLRGRDGSYRWFLTRARPICDETGKVVRWFGTNTDVTEQIEAEQALRELNETLEQRVAVETQERLGIWNVSQDLLAVADLEGRYLSINPAWTATLGWSAADLIGKTSQWLLHPDDRARTLAEIAHLAAGGTTVHFESRFRHQDGSYRWISWNAAPDRARIYAVGRDVTDLKDAENKLRDARRELAHAARHTTLSTMTAALAHEIRQPLGAVVTHANAGLRWLNRAEPDLDEARDAFRHIVEDGYRTSEVIQSVRAMFAKGDQTGDLLDANNLVCDTIAIVRGELDAARIFVKLELADKLPSIAGHKGQLQQVILNAVNNAADAMRPVADRARLLTVTSGALESNEVALSIEDSGTGVDPKDADRIFEAFFTTKSNGMGMGLAICRSIIEAHGGRLSVSPAAVHGSVFRMILPASPS